MPDRHSQVSRSEMGNFARVTLGFPTLCVGRRFVQRSSLRSVGLRPGGQTGDPERSDWGLSIASRCEETGDPKRSDWGLSIASRCEENKGLREDVLGRTGWSTSAVCRAGIGRHEQDRRLTCLRRSAAGRCRDWAKRPFPDGS
jgi:hypothetical protein